MGLMDSMIAGSALANGIVGLDAGTALWLMMMVALVGSGLGIVMSASGRRFVDLGVLRRPRLSTAASQLCEAGGV